MENYSQSGYFSSTITSFKKISTTKTNFGKPPAGGGARGRIRNSAELARLHFLDFSAENGNEDVPIRRYFGFGQEIKEKLDNTVSW